MDQNKHTIATFDAMLKSPKISRIIQEAVDAPVGSTKKAHAKSILSIVHKTNPNHVYIKGTDGEGGIGETGHFSSYDRYQGQGGPFDSLSLGNTVTQNPALQGFSTEPTQNYTFSAPIIFPQVPTLSTKTNKATSTPSIAEGLSNVFGKSATGLVWETDLATVNAANAARAAKEAAKVSNVATNTTSNTNALGYNNGGVFKNDLSKLTVGSGASVSEQMADKFKGLALPKEVAPVPTAFTGNKVAKTPVKPFGLVQAGSTDAMAPNTPNATSTAGVIEPIPGWTTKAPEGTQVPGFNPQKTAGLTLPQGFNSFGMTGMSGVQSNISNNPIIPEKTAGKVGAGQQGTSGAGASQIPGKTGNQQGASGTNQNAGSQQISGSYSSKTTTTGKQPVDGSVSSDLATGEPARALSIAEQKAMAKKYIDNNLGAEMFAQDALKSMGVAIPEEQLASLKEALKKQYNVEALLDRKTKMEEAGTTAQSDMVDYVKGKDQFVQHINSLIDAADAKAKTMDMADPRNKSMMDEYRNYLVALKGRQNKGYADMVNKSIESLNNDIKRVDAGYTDALKRMGEDYTMQGGIKEQQYKDTKAALTNLYNEMQDAPGKLVQAETARINLLRAQRDLANPSSGSGKDTSSWPEEINKSKDFVIDSKGNTKPDFNLSKTMAMLTGESDQDPRAVLYLATEGWKQDLTNLNSSASTDIAPVTSKTKNALTQLSETYADLKNSYGPAVEPLMKPRIKSAGAEIIAKQGEGINSYILQNYDIINDAVKDLEKNFNSTSHKKMSLTEWEKKHSDIDSSVLSSIYDNYSFNKNSAPDYSIKDEISILGRKDTAFGSLPDDKKMAKYISTELTDSNTYNWNESFNNF